MISGPNRIVGWIGVAFSFAILIYGVWFAATLAAFSYAVPKFEQIQASVVLFTIAFMAGRTGRPDFRHSGFHIF